jgi:hypothetical protein
VRCSNGKATEEVNYSFVIIYNKKTQKKYKNTKPLKRKRSVSMTKKPQKDNPKALFQPGDTAVLHVEEFNETVIVKILDVIPKVTRTGEVVYFYVTNCDDYPFVAESLLKKIETQSNQ